MQIIKAINRIDALMPNTYTQEEKIDWLSALDSMIKREVIDTHEGWEAVEFEGYDQDTPLTKELLVGDPYDDIYVLWLECKIHYTNGEYGKYNNAVIKFNDLFAAFKNDYNRKHMPIGSKFRYY